MTYGNQILFYSNTRAAKLQYYVCSKTRF